MAFAHIDCDCYSSAKVVLDLLAPRLRRGTVLVFDELMNYSHDWPYSGEFQALLEFQQAHPKFRFAWHARGAAPSWPPRMRVNEHTMQAALIVEVPP